MMRKRIKEWLGYTVTILWLGIVVGSGVAIGFVTTLVLWSK
jgi:hypothetical protein